MSQVAHDLIEILDEEDHKPEPPRNALAGSLEHRVAERRKALEAAATHKFDVPGFEGVLKVELQLVGGKRQHQIFRAHEHIRDEYQQALRTGCDLILAATVAFYSVSGEDDVLAEGITWKRLAKAANRHLDDAVLEAKGGNRVALISLIGEGNVLEFVGEWKTWVRSRGDELEQQLEDFS